MKRPQIGFGSALVAAAAFLTLCANLAFFRNARAVMDATSSSGWHLLSLGLVVFCLVLVMLTVLGSRRSLKPVLVVLFLLSSLCAYFMDSYNVIIDGGMLANAAATDWAETRDLLTPRLLLYLLALGIAPSIAMIYVGIRPSSFARSLGTRLGLGAAAAVTAFGLMVLSGSFYASVIREHKVLRFYTNPLTPMYGLYQFLRPEYATRPGQVLAIGEDAFIPPVDPDRELIIMVVGEAARSDHFSLNGYGRATNPRLWQLDVVSFDRVSSCGTSTAVSVPCMFAVEGRSQFHDGIAEAEENVLDVLTHAGVHVLWRDNNSTSKGVSLRIPTEDYHADPGSHDCGSECRDVDMLDGLQGFIDRQATGDVLIVLHQMGSHGPAYDKRYPDEFRRFLPVCESSQLDRCSKEEIRNSYDNTILYTDYFLSRVVELLQANDGRFETALFYVSDHGESLGEMGLYLHGAPFLLAPESQKRVPMIFWFGRNYDDSSIAAMEGIRNQAHSHDEVFHTLLGFFEVSSSVYDRKKDLLQQARDFSAERGLSAAAVASGAPAAN